MMARMHGAMLAGMMALGSGGALAQQAAAPPPGPPQFPDMTFFITSQPGPDGANFGGLEGADAHCQKLATTAGAGGKAWRAYLSQQALGGKPAVHARDRIGKGPWVNAKGVQIAANVADLHDQDKAKISQDNGITESGKQVMGRTFLINFHDILTGSTPEGTAPAADKDMTCANWTSGKDGLAIVGHHDRVGLSPPPAGSSWNSSHPTRGCDNAALRTTGGNGLLYCFAAN